MGIYKDFNKNILRRMIGNLTSFGGKKLDHFRVILGGILMLFGWVLGRDEPLLTDCGLDILLLTLWPLVLHCTVFLLTGAELVAAS